MKPKQINDIKMGLFAVGIMAVIASHFLVHEPMAEAMLELEGDIAAAETEKARLKQVEAQLPAILAETEECRIIVENEMLKYPEDVLYETFIMYAENLRNNLDVNISGVAISAPTQMSAMEIMRYVNEVDEKMPIAAYRSTLSFSWDFTYDQLKSFIAYVHSEQERTAVENVSVSYNAATGHLTGSTVINKYFIATPNYIYSPPDIPLTDIGTTNPFGTVEEE